MLVSEIGEFGLIRRLAEVLGVEYPPTKGRAHGSLRVGLGDDAAVSQKREGSLVWTTDTMVSGVHFLPERTAWRDTGWKALAVNLSDIAAMGARPDLALVTLLLPAAFCVEDAVDLYRGLKDIADESGITIGGGDIVRAPVFAVTVALSGWASTSRLGQPLVMTRDAALPGYLVAVSGTLGDSAGGLRLLDDGAALDDATSQLRAAHERPVPRVHLGPYAAKAGVRCAIDVSDGLVQDLSHVARASNVAIRIDANRIPVSEALHETFPGRALGLALSGGEDYELVLIAPPAVMEGLLHGVGPSQTDRPDVPLTVIGEVVVAHEPGVRVVDESGWEIPMGHTGWDHLAP